MLIILFVQIAGTALPEEAINRIKLEHNKIYQYNKGLFYV